MTQQARRASDAVSTKFVVIVVDSYVIDAADQDDARAQVQALRPSTHADTTDVQVEVAKEEADD